MKIKYIIYTHNYVYHFSPNNFLHTVHAYTFTYLSNSELAFNCKTLNINVIQTTINKYFITPLSSLYSNNRSVFINSLSKILCSDFHLMSAFEKTRYLYLQSEYLGM